MRSRIFTRKISTWGYRYFETFCPEKVLYPFGYGLSYTTFETKVKGAVSDTETITITAEVKNTGDCKGKEVVQVYVHAPQGTLGKPARELKAFAKTKELVPGETEELILLVPVKRLASYDDSGRDRAEILLCVGAGSV